MQYAILIYESEADFDRRTNQERDQFWAAWKAYHQMLKDAGVYLGGHKLQPPGTATTLRMRGGKRQVQDGPFADTKEQLGGLIVVEAASLREALEWAEKCPAASYCLVEVRPVAASAIPVG